MPYRHPSRILNPNYFAALVVSTTLVLSHFVLSHLVESHFTDVESVFGVSLVLLPPQDARVAITATIAIVFFMFVVFII
jgi:hypothetical protein